NELVNEYNVNTENFTEYSYRVVQTRKEGNTFIKDTESNYSDETIILYLVSIDDYNKLQNKDITLNDNEVLWADLNVENEGITESNISLNETNYSIKDFVKIDKFNLEENYLVDGYMMVVPNEQIIYNTYKAFNSEDEIIDNALSYSFQFNLKLEDENDRNFFNDFQTQLKDNELSYQVYHKDIMEENYLSMYGGFLFIGIFLGIEFLIATALIIYYKQISEGYDDKNRYEIMQKVGMSKQEIKKSIHFQVLSVFFLPLIVAVIHYGFAFKMITQLLAIFQLTNTSLFLWCSVITIVVFIIFYTIVYVFTSKAYYKIVK
ncbi:MAG: ABC transporter permease, partial [Coprobacillaceae bacterium]